MIDLTTTYLGLSLKNPVVASASPLSKKVGTARQMEDAGAAAALDRHALWACTGRFRADKRRADRAGCGQSDDGGRERGNDYLGAVAPMARGASRASWQGWKSG